MAGDLNIYERVVLEGAGAGDAAAAAADAPERAIHRYGRLSVVADTTGTVTGAGPGAADLDTAIEELPELERLGLAAFRLRESAEYRTEKEHRPRAGEEWDMPDCTSVVPPLQLGGEAGDMATRAGPTSSFMEGSVAVGIIIVQGPTADLQFSDAERIKVVAEVQNGLGYFATANPVAGITFTYDIHNVVLNVPADPSAADLEGRWRNPAMASLGFTADGAGVLTYVNQLRDRLRTRWTYCAFFTKYPVNHFAYASIGGPRMVMHYLNDGWGPDNIDRVFAHETGHIFGCPDEYATSKCDCGGAWGRFGIENGNCENCAALGGVPCLMKANDFTMCQFTPSHLGWGPRLLVNNFGHTAGGWRIDQHPRFLADTTADGRADVVGFGNAGVYVSRAQANGTFGAIQLVVPNFGFEAGGWRVNQHPRFLADTTGDGRADVVGFGNAGMYVSRAQADGSFGPVQLVVPNFGYDAGGWRVEQHPRLLADTTADGRADVVGFGNAGVYMSRAQADGSFGPVQLVVGNFGYDAGGWRVEQHPRLLADTTGDGRADVVGFGNAGVYVSRAQADGSYGPVQLVVGNYGYVAGGWRVERHPRFVLDITGDGRADIVGFGEAGVYVSLARADGTYSAPQLVVDNFGATAGGWRVDRHPRFLADTTGDGLPDIVGFGEAGVYVSRSLGGGSFEAPKLVIKNFGYTAGGWRVEQHPRFLADTTGDRRADVVGFGFAGVYVSRS